MTIFYSIGLLFWVWLVGGADSPQPLPSRPDSCASVDLVVSATSRPHPAPLPEDGALEFLRNEKGEDDDKKFSNGLLVAYLDSSPFLPQTAVLTRRDPLAAARRAVLTAPLRC